MRKIEKLMKGWTFTDGSGRQTILDLPHTWNGKDGQDGGNDYWRGTCTYERQVKKPEFGGHQRVYLQFHGVNASAKVMLNGNHVCSHDGGYSTFRVDVTDLLMEDNHLLVEVDNSINDHVYPQKVDFTFYGGIYRDVELIREIGANTVRLAHYQHDQYFYDLCDKYGLIVWAEIPYISEHLPKGRENTFS